MKQHPPLDKSGERRQTWLRLIIIDLDFVEIAHEGHLLQTPFLGQFCQMASLPLTLWVILMGLKCQSLSNGFSHGT